jgi:LysM repeat protein
MYNTPVIWHILQYMLTLRRPQFYKVKEGQTLREIADAFSIPQTLLMQENKITKPLQAGEILYLPATRGNLYTTQAGDSKRLLCGSDENYASRNGTDTLYPTMRVFL